MTEHAHAPDAPPAEHSSHKRDYFRIFWVLLVLTILEVAVSYLKIDKRVISTLMVGLALTKAACVGLFYMHLKYEKRSLMWLAFVPLPLTAFYAVFLMLDGFNLLRAGTVPWVHH